MPLQTSFLTDPRPGWCDCADLSRKRMLVITKPSDKRSANLPTQPPEQSRARSTEQELGALSNIQAGGCTAYTEKQRESFACYHNITNVFTARTVAAGPSDSLRVLIE